MGWLKCISLLGCALVLANPSCHGAVWTAEDEARALNQGKGRISNTAPDGLLRVKEDESLLQSQEEESLEREQSLRAQFDEERARHKGRGRFQQPAPHQDRGRFQQPNQANPSIEGRRKGDAAQFSPYEDRFRQYDSRTRYEGRTQGSQTRQFDGRTHESASQSDGFAQTQFDGRTQFTDENEKVEATEEPDSADGGCISCRFINSLSRKEAKKSEAAESEAGYFGDTFKSLTNAVFGGQSDGANEDGLAETFNSERKYLEHRLQQLDNPSDSTRFGGQPQDASASPHAKQNQAELEYLEYRRTQQLYDSVQDVQPIQNDPTQDARFGGQRNQGGRTVESNAELEYLEYRRTQQLYDDSAQDVQPIQYDPTQDARFGGQHNQGGRTEEYRRAQQFQDAQPIQNDPTQDARFGGQHNQRTEDSNAELEYQEYRRAQQFRDAQDAQPIQNDPTQDARFGKPGGRHNQRTEDSNAELEYQEYRRAQQFYDDSVQDVQPNLDNARFGGQARDYKDYSTSTNPRFGSFDFTSQDSGRRNFGSNNEYDPALGNARLGGHPQDSDIQDLSGSAELEYLEYRQNLLDADTQDIGNLNLNDRSPYDSTNLDQSVSANTRFGSQVQSATTNTRFGGQSQDRPASTNTRFGSKTQDQFSSTNTRFRSETNPRFGGRTQDDYDGFGGESRGFGSEHPVQGFGEEFPAAADFDGRTPQASTQLDAENFEHDSRRFGFEALPQKTEAELAFEAFEAEAEATLREAQKAFEVEVNRLRLLGCSSCHLVLQGAAVKEGNSDLLKVSKLMDHLLKVSKLMDVDESVEAPRSILSRNGCVTCHLINPPSPAPAPLVEGAEKAGHFKVPILVDVDYAGRAAHVQNRNPSGALDLRKAASFQTSILMATEDRPYNPAARRAPSGNERLFSAASRRGPSGNERSFNAASRRGPSGNERSFNAAPRRGPSGNERSFNAAQQKRLKATQVRERGCRSCHVVHG